MIVLSAWLNRRFFTVTLRTWHFENAFVALHAYSALVGCGIFALYPVWRRLWRRWHPLPS